jgi:D-alanine-D-alanine ligase
VSRRLRVGIFAGGRSAEHEVSIASAESVLRAIDRERFEPYLIYIGRDGAWHLPAGPAPELGDGSLAALLGAETPTAQAARLRSAEDPEARLPLASGDDPLALQPRQAVRSLAEAIDVAFLVLHGPFGEDGTLQGFLELAGIPYTGAGVLASAVAMDKVVFKDLMRGHGLPVVDYTWFRRPSWRSAPERVLREARATVGDRCVVKPARLGSSVGMSLVHDPTELPAAFDEAFRYDAKVIVERYVPGARELEVGVIGNDQPVAFEPGEVRSHHEWYDYEAKYVAGLADVDPRADLDPALAARLKELALAAYRAVDCAGLARVDFLAPPGELYISEMNTLPGFTTTSMYPKQAELAGITFDELIARLIELGLEAAGDGPSRDAASRDAASRDAAPEGDQD